MGWATTPFLFMSTKPHFKDLEVVPNQYSKKNYTINISIPEFNCVCIIPEGQKPLVVLEEA